MTAGVGDSIFSPRLSPGLNDFHHMSYLVLKPGMVLSHSIEDYPEGIVVPVDKPYRWTSADVIRKVKWMAVKHFGKKNLKVGHAGTLDPLATGVLLVCIGKATKLAEEFQKAPKRYLAGVTFGATTASYDLEKNVDTRCPLDGVSEEALRRVLPGFIGEQEQVAPLFSAKSVDGVRVYELARKRYKAGLPVEEPGLLRASHITIYDLKLEAFGQSVASDEVEGKIHVAALPAGLLQAEILVDCSKGTYIRALARDLGEALGSGAFLHSLRRTRNGGFAVEDALSIPDIEAVFPRNQKIG